MTVNGLDQNGEHRTSLTAAGLPQGEDSLNPAVAFVTRGPEAWFSPNDTEAQRSFSPVVRGLDALDGKKHPEGFHLTQQTSGEFTCDVLSIKVVGDESAQPGVECPPLADGRRRMGHIAETADFHCSPFAEGCDLRIASLCEIVGSSDEMGEACLPQIHLVFVNPIAVTDQDAIPVFDQRGKSLLGAFGVNHEEGNAIVHQHPEPHEVSTLPPARFVDIVDLRLSRRLRNGLIMGTDRGRNPVHHLLHGALTDGDFQEGLAELHDTDSTVALVACHAADQCRQFRTVSRFAPFRNVCFDEFAAMGTPRLVKSPVQDVHLDLWKLDHLMHMLRSALAKVFTAARTPFGFDVHALGRLEHDLSIPRMSLLATGFSFLLVFGLSLVRVVAGWWSIRITRILLQFAVDLVNLLSQFLQMRERGDHKRLDRLRGLVPAGLTEGKPRSLGFGGKADRIGRWRLLFHEQIAPWPSFYARKDAVCPALIRPFYLNG
jgi:hypothetical protein